MSTTFDMMEYGWVLAWDEEIGCAITWNGCTTYNFWITSDSGASWTNTDVRTYDPTNGGTFISMNAAAVFAGDYLRDVIEGEGE